MGQRLCYVIGTRPEVIRSAAILRAFASDHPGVEVDLVNTGQHFDPPMMSLLAEEVGLPTPARTLAARQGSQGKRFAEIIADMVKVLDDRRFDAVVVYGDTDSSLAAAMAGVKTRTPVVHVEAGCRSGDMRMQEEMNRRAIDHVSALHLAVSDTCLAHLRAELAPGHAVVTGDPQFDVFWDHRPVVDEQSGQTGFVTMHRAENVDDPSFLRKVLAALDQFGQRTGTVFTWAAHPRTASFFDGMRASPWVEVVPPLAYRQTLELLARSRLCVTDSGGLQKEAFWLRTPCVTMRPTTEWVETVDAGANTLCPVPEGLDRVLAGADSGRAGVRWDPDPYGGLGSSQRVVGAIVEWLDVDGGIGWTRSTSV